MLSNQLVFLVLIVSFLPFISFAYLNSKANTRKEYRYRQYLMPLLAIVYCVVLFVKMDQISSFLLNLVLKLAELLKRINMNSLASILKELHDTWGIYLSLILFNNAALVFYITCKRIITIVLGCIEVKQKTMIASIVEIFYSYSKNDERWYIRNHFGQARAFIKTAYYGACFITGILMFVSCDMCMNSLISEPFYPVFAIIIIGELAFYIDGFEEGENKSKLELETDKARRICMYPWLIKPLSDLFGDKLANAGTTVSSDMFSANAIEDILVNIERNGGHIGENYASFVRAKMDRGLKPNADYVRCGYDLATGKSLLFNTPFYDKLNPYVFYAMNRELLKGGKVLIVLGRHGTEEDLEKWAKDGMKEVSNIEGLWKIEKLVNKKIDEDNMPDIGIISRSDVHNPEIHKMNMLFLHRVSFIVLIEPSKLVTTAQIGLNLLIKCCGKERPITACSVDRNCDGLVDSLSHILMANITEVSATEYPHGMSSYMYWLADDDYLQHRILPGISRFLGMGTELSAVALKNQINKATWYGGEDFPVIDAHWIAKQYYHDLLDYANLPANQETFDSHFLASYNMCNEKVGDYSFINVEDDRNNLFETRRNFATISEEQGFVNVISTEYMLREYMSENPEIFTADSKAIPYIAADYARTKRNAILSLCLLLCVDSISEEVLLRQVSLLGIKTDYPIDEIWKALCELFSIGSDNDKKGNPMLVVKGQDGNIWSFAKEDTIVFKRQYSYVTGKFESVYAIDNPTLSKIILDDLQNASYIAEQESKNFYIGSELKGHIYQKYLPGQFFTISGKYYEMIGITPDNHIMVRRAADHIDGRICYRQIRNYHIEKLEDSDTMGALKTVNNIKINYQYADLQVETPGYWKLRVRNDFDNGDLVKVNGVPIREYRHKQILRIDFSNFGEEFTDSIRMTLTNLLNETFTTLFAENQPYISAVTLGHFDAPLTYSLDVQSNIEDASKCIFIIEDSQLDIGLLVAFERNIERIFQIVSDYLSWNEEAIENSRNGNGIVQNSTVNTTFELSPSEEEKKGLFARIGAWFKKLFKKKRKEETDNKSDQSGMAENEEHITVPIGSDEANIIDESANNPLDGINETILEKKTGVESSSSEINEVSKENESEEMNDKINEPQEETSAHDTVPTMENQVGDLSETSNDSIGTNESDDLKHEDTNNMFDDFADNHDQEAETIEEESSVLSSERKEEDKYE